MTGLRRIPACLTIVVLACATVAAAAGAAAADVAGSRSGDAIVIKSGGRELLRYQLKKPADVKLPVDSGGYFHPLATPSGVVVTDVAPPDHPHHRGVFLAWVETHGKVDADFWGWGEHAPIKDRRVVNRDVSGPTVESRADSAHSAATARFAARNEWLAENSTLLGEQLGVTWKLDTPNQCTILDLTYTLTPTADLTLSRWAFSGFCVRTLGPTAAPQLTALGPAGEVKLPNPSHLKPESDWPAAPWYGYQLKLKDGTVVGVAVIDHPKNPPSLWHNHRDVRMLNPCIVAPDKVVLKAKEPLVLRYRVVAHDGPTRPDVLDRLAREWRGQ